MARSDLSFLKYWLLLFLAGEALEFNVANKILYALMDCGSVVK
jgi:hypothetical protein